MWEVMIFLSAGVFAVSAISWADSTDDGLPGNIVDIKNQDNKTVSVFIAGLESKDPKIRYSCTGDFLRQAAGVDLRDTAGALVAALRNEGQTITDEAIREIALSVRYRNNRAAAGILLELIGRGDFISEWIFAALDTYDEDLRLKFVEALSKSSNPMAVDGLIKAAREDESGTPRHDIATRIKAIQALGDKQDKKAVKLLLELTSDSDFSIKQPAIAALGKLSAPEALPIFEDIIKSDSSEYYYDVPVVIRALGQMGTVPQAARLLADYIIKNTGKSEQTSSYYLIKSALEGLVNLQAIDQIDRLINDSDERVRLLGLRVKANLDEMRAAAALQITKSEVNQAVFGQNVQEPIVAAQAAAQATLKTISVAAESYAAANNRYPDNMSDLTRALPPYLSEDYTKRIFHGYAFSCTISISGYSCSATPQGDYAGKACSYKVITGGVMEKYEVKNER